MESLRSRLFSFVSPWIKEPLSEKIMLRIVAADRDDSSVGELLVLEVPIEFVDDVNSDLANSDTLVTNVYVLEPPKDDSTAVAAAAVDTSATTVDQTPAVAGIVTGQETTAAAGKSGLTTVAEIALSLLGLMALLFVLLVPVSGSACYTVCLEQMWKSILVGLNGYVFIYKCKWANRISDDTSN